MAILKAVLESGIDTEVKSGGELFKALRAGIPKLKTRSFVNFGAASLIA
jgi:diaminopimelate decarboxylase